MQENLAATMCGSPSYMAPEIMRCEDYDAKVCSFTYAFGCFNIARQ